MYWTFCTYSVHFLQTLSNEISSEYVPSGHFWHTVSCKWLPERTTAKNRLSTLQKQSWSFIIFSVDKRGLRASDRCVIPLDWTPCPGLQVVCGTQVIHSLAEQWNPCLHMQVLRLSLLWSGTRKFLSERIVDKSRTLCHIKQKSINTGTVLFDLSQGLTWVTVWLTLTVGVFCVFFLILIPATVLALRFQTSAERCHAGPWKTQCCFTMKHA